MDKKEESELLELQDLALKHKSSKRQKTLEEKQMIVKAHLLNHQVGAAAADVHVRFRIVGGELLTENPNLVNPSVLP